MMALAAVVAAVIMAVVAAVAVAVLAAVAGAAGVDQAVAAEGAVPALRPR
jgi:hypothetical protein